MTVRRAKKSDIPEIARLLYQVHDLHATGRPDLFKKGMRKYDDARLAEILGEADRPVFVCAEGERLLGYAFCVIKTENDPSHMPIKTLYLDDLCVDGTARRRGVGKTLYDRVCAYAVEIGCHNLTLNVWACNPGALRFYEKMGMKVQKFGMETLLERADGGKNEGN